MAFALPADPTVDRGVSPLLAGCALAAIAALALALRAQGFEWVFVDDETVVFPPGDAQYHVRRSLQAWIHFPQVLLWDSYINFPDGAAISWPPLFDFVVGGAARLFVRDAAGFDRFVAWVPPVLGALATFPVYLLGRELGTRVIGLGAAAIFALLPLSVSYSRVGQLDHHCGVALIGAWLLYANVKVVATERARAPLMFGLAIARIAMLLTWHGSLLYLVLVDSVLWTVAAVTSRRDVYAVQAGSAAITCFFVGPIVWLFPEPLGGAYSAIALSRMHVLAMLGVSLVSAGLWWMDRPRADRSARTPAARLVATVGTSFVVALVLLSLPGPREGLEPALRFLTMTDGVGARTGEQLPLFSLLGRPSGRPAWEVWGGLAWLIPLLPLGVVWGAPLHARRAAWVVAGWCLYFGVLAIIQRRYGNDLGPSIAVATAVTAAALSQRMAHALGLTRRWGAVFACLLCFALLAPPVLGQYRSRAVSAVRALRGGAAAGDRALATVAGSLTRFLEQVRRVTPETSGFDAASAVPEYGIVADPNLGHAIQNVARRPTPVDPFWAFIGQQNWDRAEDLRSASTEARALEMSEALGARYVVTMSSASRGSLELWLHEGDGLAAQGRPRSEHFRLVTEGPRDGKPLSAALVVTGNRKEEASPESRSPYKLFEIVNGALLEVGTGPGEEVRVALALESPARRKLVWRASELADAEGVARIRVLYPTGQSEHADRVHARGAYHITTSSGSRVATVTERDIATGTILRFSVR